MKRFERRTTTPASRLTSCQYTRGSSLSLERGPVDGSVSPLAVVNNLLHRAMSYSLQDETLWTHITIVTVRPMLWDRCPVCPVCLYRWCIEAKRLDGPKCHLDYGGRSRCRRHCVRRHPAPQGKGHSSPHFLAHVYCGQTVASLSNCCAVVVDVLIITIIIIITITHPQRERTT